MMAAMLSSLEHRVQKRVGLSGYGSLGSVERVAIGASATTSGSNPVSRDSIINGTIPSNSGTVPSATSIWRNL